MFAWLQRLGDIDEDEMEQVFNLGIGLALVVSPYYADSIRHQISECGVECWQIGRVTAGKRSVVWSEAR